MQEERNPQQDEELEGRTGRTGLSDDEQVEGHVKHRTGMAEEAGEEDEVEGHARFVQVDRTSEKPSKH